MTSKPTRHLVFALAAVLSAVATSATAQDLPGGAFTGYDRVFEQHAPCNPALQNC
jgi:hypothetical protein